MRAWVQNQNQEKRNWKVQHVQNRILEAVMEEVDLVYFSQEDLALNQEIPQDKNNRWLYIEG